MDALVEIAVGYRWVRSVRARGVPVNQGYWCGTRHGSGPSSHCITRERDVVTWLAIVERCLKDHKEYDQVLAPRVRRPIGFTVPFAETNGS